MPTMNRRNFIRTLLASAAALGAKIKFTAPTDKIVDKHCIPQATALFKGSGLCGDAVYVDSDGSVFPGFGGIPIGIVRNVLDDGTVEVVVSGARII